MTVSDAKSLARRKAVLTRWHGKDDARTVEAALALAEAIRDRDQAEVDRLRAQLDALAVAS